MVLDYFFQFSDEKCIECIKNICVRVDLIFLSKKPDWKKICEPIFNELLLNLFFSEPTKKIIKKDKNYFNNFESRQITKMKLHQCTGGESLGSNSSVVIKTYFNYDIDKFYIFFEDHINKIIYKEKSFDKISFIVDNVPIIEFDYEDLLYETDRINITNKKLPKGVYEIEWKNILDYRPFNIFVKLDGVTIPNTNIFINIYAESYNYLQYEDDLIDYLFKN